MTFDWLSRFRRPGPARDPRAQHHPQRPPMMIARVHGKRPAPAPQVRRGHQMPVAVPRPAMPRKGPVARPLVPSRKGPIARPLVPSRKIPVARPPSRGAARPHPSQLDPLQCLHLHFHPSQKRDLALPPPRHLKHMNGQQAPPFPPPRGVPKAPSRHVHWAPAQAPLPTAPYPYPSQASSHTLSLPRSRQYPSPPQIPRYQPPSSSRGTVPLPRRR